MKNTLTTHAKQVYRRCTASTKRRALYAVPASFLFFVYGTTFFGGIAIGAAAHLNGKSLSHLLSTVDATGFELWMNFAKEGELTKSVFGVLYPTIGLLLVTMQFGIHLGYAVPQLGYVVKRLNLLWPVVGLGLIVMQLIRFYQITSE